MYVNFTITGTILGLGRFSLESGTSDNDFKIYEVKIVVGKLKSLV